MYGSVILLIANWIFGGSIVTTDAITTKSIIMLFYIGLVVTGLGYWAYFGALKHSATMASLSYLIKPALSPFVAFFLNSVPLSVGMFVGLILVLAGSYVVSYSDKKIVPTKENIAK